MDMKKYAKAMEDLEAGRNLEEAIRIVYSTSITDDAQFQAVLAHHKKEAERKQSQTGELNHPVFGKLVRTHWAGLLTFRQFPHLRSFGKDGRASDGKPFIEHLDERERKLVEDWKSTTPQLIAICRNGPIHASLRCLGVSEMSVDVPDDGLPTQAQEKAYQHFAAHEKEVCEAVVDALMRYYKFARQEMPDWFDYLNEEDRPDNPSVTEFARLCPFDSLAVCRGAAKGLSPLRFDWSPIWDDEHGLATIVFQRQVIMIGADLPDFGVDDPKEFLKQCEEYGWGRKQMTESETIALDEFVSDFQPGAGDEE